MCSDDVHVFDLSGIRYLRLRSSVLGLQHLSDPSAPGFVAFSVMSAVCDLAFSNQDPAPFLQIGLGVGAVPYHAATSCSSAFSVVHAVEKLPAVARAAHHYFHYDAVPSPPVVADGASHLEGSPASRYSAIAMDCWDGRNSLSLFTRPLLSRVRDAWLRPGGVLAVNFIAFEGGAFEGAFRGLLGDVFEHAECYRGDGPGGVEEQGEEAPPNIVCFCSQQPIAWEEDRGGGGSVEWSHEWVRQHFREWRLAEAAGGEGEGELEDDAAAMRDLAAAEDAMRRAVRGLLPEEVWDVDCSGAGEGRAEL
jgi:hypothetical protein